MTEVNSMTSPQMNPQGVQLSLAPGQIVAKNQFVSGVEVTTFATAIAVISK